MSNSIKVKVKSFKWMIDNNGYDENLECFVNGCSRYLFRREDLDYCGKVVEVIKNGNQYIVLNDDQAMLPDWSVEVL